MRAPFNDGWSVQRLPDGEAVPVRLPHDAMLGEGRAPDAPSGAHAAHFRGGRYLYRKAWWAPADLAGKQVMLLFEGVYRHTTVRVNGRTVGGWTNGYDEAELRIDAVLTPGADNAIEVEVDNSALPNARWYTGSGIYRPVWLDVRDAVHIRRDGIRFRTLATGEAAKAEVALDIANPDGLAVGVAVRLEDERGVAAQATGDGTTAIMLDVPDARPWSADAPNLYDLVVVASVDGIARDEERQRVGLRTIAMDGRGGLRINGGPVLLRGGNIHHDNGVLGAATHRDAEFRRVRLLKQAGFNAIRSAHNPISRALLEACDAIGLYVMDELFDGWYDRKTTHDDAHRFVDTWRASADAMVAKNRNHPSVILHSIGNENSEPVSAYGLETVRRMAAHVSAADPTRGTTIGVNLMSAALAWPRMRKGSTTEPPAGKAAPNMNSTMVNVITNQFARLMKLVPRLKRTDAVTRDVFAAVDVAGYNYGTVRYARDAALHPDRVIVGTETVPGDVAETWGLVNAIPNVIGDFMWSAWDYLGEAGIGTWEYDSPARLYKPYPHLTAGCGAIDIIGTPDASLRHAQAAWGTLDVPAITVRPIDVAQRKVRRTAWRSTDAVESWAWKGCAGRPAFVEVVSHDDAVELRLNGHSLGRQNTVANVARFTVVYAPGEIVAIGYRGGVETGRSRLASAGAVRVRLRVDRAALPADGDALAFVSIELADAHGVIEMSDDDRVKLTVDGPATLAGFGSARPANVESFTGTEHATWRGRALAVIRAGKETGTIMITARSARHGKATLTLPQVDFNL